MQENKKVKLARTAFTTAKQEDAPMISLTPRDGKFTFNLRARTLMQLKNQEYIDVFEEKTDRTTRFGFQKTDDRTDSYCLRQRQSTSKHPPLCIINKALQRHIQKKINLYGNLKAQIASEPDEEGVWWILESSWKQTKKQES